MTVPTALLVLGAGVLLVLLAVALYYAGDRLLGDLAQFAAFPLFVVGIGLAVSGAAAVEKALAAPPQPPPASETS